MIALAQPEAFVGMFALAFVRYAPAVVLPGFSPLRWAPALVRIVLALGLAWLTVLSLPDGAFAPAQRNAGYWIAAAFSEFGIGMVFGLALMVPQAALHTAGWVLDVQAGMGAATLFNPGSQSDAQSLLGTALMLIGTVRSSRSTCIWSCIAAWWRARRRCRSGVSARARTSKASSA